MSSSNSTDPRLLLPDWLRDGDAPLPVQTVPPTALALPEADIVEAEVVAPVATQAVAAAKVAIAPAIPFSDRLTLDTRLDPALLVSSEDLPGWLGGLERTAGKAPQVLQFATATPVTHVAPIAEPEPYAGVDAPEDGVIDVQINGWYLIAGAVGLLVLLGAALRLYLD